MIGAKDDFRIFSAFQDFAVHAAVATAIPALSGGGVGDQGAAHTVVKQVVFGVAAFQLKCTVLRVQDISQGELDGGLFRRELKPEFAGLRAGGGAKRKQGRGNYRKQPAAPTQFPYSFPAMIIGGFIGSDPPAPAKLCFPL